MYLDTDVSEFVPGRKGQEVSVSATLTMVPLPGLYDVYGAYDMYDHVTTSATLTIVPVPGLGFRVQGLGVSLVETVRKRQELSVSASLAMYVYI